MSRLAVIVLVSLGVIAQAQDQDPHEGKPSYCVNHGGFKDFPMQEPHVCNCDKPCHEGQPEDTQCTVYCEPDHCHCIAECEKEPPPIPKANP